MLRGTVISYDWYKTAEGQGLLAHLTDPSTGYRQAFLILISMSHDALLSPQEAVRTAGEPSAAALHPHAPVQAVPGGEDGQRQDLPGQLAGGAAGLELHSGGEPGRQGHSGM